LTIMKPVIGCDAHKHYSVFVQINEEGKASAPFRVEHDRERFREYLDSLAIASDMAVESTGHWYWIVDEREHAGHHPHLAEPLEAKKRMGKTHKTDALDAKGLAILLRNGTLPEVWVPPADIRDKRELLRTRMALRDVRTMLKHRIHSALERYGVFCSGVSDLFGVTGRQVLAESMQSLPLLTREMIDRQLESFDLIGRQVELMEARIDQIIQPDATVKTMAKHAGRRQNLGPRDRPGDRRRAPLCLRRATRQLLRLGPAPVLLRRTHAPGRHISFCQSVSQMGFCRGR
jgi:transposase